jgi:uncharacterized protein (UPF0264 family)
MKLMISVVSPAEALEAMRGGADILDVKNPAEGSLGAQFPAVIREIRQIASGKVQVGAAIGDMPNLPGTASLAALGAAVCGVDYVKVGLYGLQSEADALKMLEETQKSVREYSSFVVAAGYADFRRAGTLNPKCLPRVAAAVGVRACLLDTAIKDKHSLFDFLKPQQLRLLCRQAHESGLLFGLAGALKEEHLPMVHDLGADIVGLRTAVCRYRRRNGPLEASRVQQLRRKCDLFSQASLVLT